MTLSTGTKLAHYEITSQIGKGGMGEVYQAKDTKLGRDVAIKVLPEEFAKDADRVARFQREAKLLASLNHPNIAAIHGLEEVDGTNFLVMELVEGQTLDERIKTGAIPVEEALKLALQISEALEAAHEKGVIHRDLKPANIKVTPEGKVKVLDFGLAKAFAGEQADLNLSNSPTLSVAATQQGVILGTAAYMSPEQARGKEVDKRADIWAFGVVLFEMFTGKSLFSGEDVSSTLARVLEREPDFSSLPSKLNPKVHDILKHCLQKDTKNRFHDIADVRLDLQDILSNPNSILISESPASEPLIKKRSSAVCIAITAILSILVSGFVVWKLKPVEPGPITRFDFIIPDTQELMYPQFSMLTVSPGGRHFVYISGKGLYLHSINTKETRLLVDADEGPMTPFFSYDGQWVGYMSMTESSLKRISINRGTPEFLCNTGSCLGASWGEDNRIIYSVAQEGIRWIPANGGQPETLVDTKDYLTFHPRLLPDGKSLIYTVLDPSGEYQIAVQSLESETREVLFPGDCAWYLSTGHLVYALGNNLFAVPFDPVRLEVQGDPAQIGISVYRSEISAAPQYSISESGTLIYMPGIADEDNVAQRSLVWMHSEGREELVAIPPDAYVSPKLSLDGNKAVMFVSDGIDTRLWIWDFTRDILTPLPTDSSHCFTPIWSPDGKRIIYFSYDKGKVGIYSIAADGTGETDTLFSGTNSFVIPSSWSDKDGKMLLFYEVPHESPSVIVNMLTKSFSMARSAVLSGFSSLQSDIGMLKIEGGGEKIELLKNNFMESSPQVSPDGQWMAYVSNESGSLEIWIRPFPDVEKGRCMVSTGGTDSQPVWSPEGKKLYYRNGDSMMVVDVGTDPINNLGKPKVLFQSENLPIESSILSSLDIHPDGKRFLMLKPVETMGGESESNVPDKINIVLNWFEVLKEKVPVE
jgi:serine/threonine protein kinase